MGPCCLCTSALVFPTDIAIITAVHEGTWHGPTTPAVEAMVGMTTRTILGYICSAKHLCSHRTKDEVFAACPRGMMWHHLWKRWRREDKYAYPSYEQTLKATKNQAMGAPADRKGTEVSKLFTGHSPRWHLSVGSFECIIYSKYM